MDQLPNQGFTNNYHFQVSQTEKPNSYKFIKLPKRNQMILSSVQPESHLRKPDEPHGWKPRTTLYVFRQKKYSDNPRVPYTLFSHKNDLSYQMYMLKRQERTIQQALKTHRKNLKDLHILLKEKDEQKLKAATILSRSLPAKVHPKPSSRLVRLPKINQ